MLRWSDEAERRYQQRLATRVSKEFIEKIVAEPNTQVVSGTNQDNPNCLVWQQLTANQRGLIRVVVDPTTEPWTIVTVVYVNKPDRYWGKHVVPTEQRPQVWGNHKYGVACNDSNACVSCVQKACETGRPDLLFGPMRVV